jgi:hypothetical protein
MWKLKKHWLQKLLGMQRCTSPPKMGSWFHSLLWNLHKPRSPGYKSKRTPTRKQLFVKISHVNPWHAMFGVFLGDTSLTMTWCSVFPFFWFFLNSLGPPSRSRSNSRCHQCVPGWLGTTVWSWLQGPTPSGNLQVIFPIFLMCISCSPSSN